MFQRRFVLEPLHEIAPDLRVPPSNATVATLLEQLKDPARVRLFGTLDVSVKSQ